MDIALEKYLHNDTSPNEHPVIPDSNILENIFQLYFNRVENCIDNPICYYYYGLYHQINSNYDKMKDYYEKSLQQNMYISLNNLGCYYQNQCVNYKLAKEYYMKAIEKGICISICNMAFLYEKKGKYDKSEKYLLMGVDRCHAKCINLLERYYIKQKNKIGLLKLYAKTRQVGKYMAIVNEYFLEEKENNDIIIAIIETLENMEIQNESPNGIKFIKKLLCHQIDIMKLHFEYTVNGKGYDEAKKDYINLLTN